LKIRNITTALALTLATAAIAQEAGQAKPQHDRSPKAQSAEAQFAQYDTNKDGQVTPEEFRGGKTLFAAYDADKNGVLTLEEIRAAKHTSRPNFRALDTDKDGFVSRREWTGTQEEFDAVDMDHDGVWSRADIAMEKHRTQAQGLIERLDTNKDGVLSQDEWTAAQRDVASFRRQALNR
jgi:Ca2+-binding EF-hand superfamily protein